MAILPKEHHSIWEKSLSNESGGALAKNVTSDVCVVGAGIAGLSTAYLLALEGKSVTVLDKGPVGGGESLFTTAHLSTAIDDHYTEIVRLHGEEGAQRAAESHSAAINCIEQVSTVENINCDFLRVDGFLFLAPGQNPELLENEFTASRLAGLSDVTKVAAAPLDGFDTGPALRYPRQGQFHPIKYMRGLAVAIERLGGRIHTNTTVKEVKGGTEAHVKTANGHQISAGAIVVATNIPINDLLVIHTKQAPYTTYAIGASIPKNSFSPMLLWDFLDPYHYVRVQSEPRRDILIIGGCDHKGGQAQDGETRFRQLEQWARGRFPMIKKIVYTWCGQVMETVDGLAFIGRNPADEKNVFVATGDSGMGMTHGTIAGMLLTDLICGRPNAWEGLYDPSRKTLKAAGDFLSENANVAAQYLSWAKPGAVSSVEEIKPGTGAIIRRGLHLIAVSRDDSGKLSERSAVCTHLGCIVAWNPVEKQWNCPCHGSKFAANGEVVTGPANSALAPA